MEAGIPRLIQSPTWLRARIQAGFFLSLSLSFTSLRARAGIEAGIPMT